MGTNPSRGAGAADATTTETDEQAEVSELEVIAAMNVEDVEALAALSDEDRAALAELGTEAVVVDPEALDEPAPVSAVPDRGADEPAVERVTIPGQPGHPPVPNAGNPQIATN